MRHSAPIVCAILAAAGMSAGIAGSQAGEVMNLTGTVTLQRAQQLLPLKADDVLLAGDTVNTAADSSVQLYLEDDAYIALTQNSQLRIDQFLLPEPEGRKSLKPGKSLFTLKQGGFRTVTGLIGKSPKDAYEVVTPVAKLNEIGTDYETFFCQGNCSGFSDGLYMRVNVGIVSVVNAGGHYIAHAGETVYVANSSTRAVRVKGGSPFDNPRIETDFRITPHRIETRPRIEHEPPPSPS